MRHAAVLHFTFHHKPFTWSIRLVSTHALTVNMSGRGKGGKEQGKDI